jgi:hypothetical protein
MKKTVSDPNVMVVVAVAQRAIHIEVEGMMMKKSMMSAIKMHQDRQSLQVLRRYRHRQGGDEDLAKMLSV